MLIQLNPTHIVDSSQIVKAERSGSNLYIQLIGDYVNGQHQIRDEQLVIWDAIQRACINSVTPSA